MEVQGGQESRGRGIRTPEQASARLSAIFIPPDPALTSRRVHAEAFNYPVSIDKIVVATTSAQKQDLLRQIGNEQGVNLAPVMFPGRDENYREESMLEDENIPPGEIAKELSERKARDYISEGHPVLGLDTTLIADGKIVPKPADLTDAKTMMRDLSRKDLEVKTGITLIVPAGTESMRGHTWFFLQEDLSMSFRLNNLMDLDIEVYLARARDSVLQVPGAIDYSKSDGIELLDKRQPVRFKTSPDSIFGSKNFQMRREAVPALSTYFRGVPKEPLGAMLSLVKPIHEQVRTTY